MVAPDKVGTTADQPPVLFRPAIKGTFVWLSQRSGSFKPEEPLTLSNDLWGRHPIALGLTKADGKALAADFRETIKTPPMEVKALDGDVRMRLPRAMRFRRNRVWRCCSIPTSKQRRPAGSSNL